MDANNKNIVLLLIIFLGINSTLFSQVPKKDTLYFLFKENDDKIINKSYNNYFKNEYTEKVKGIFFNLTDDNITLFYAYCNKSDTLNISKLHNYKISNIEEANKKTVKWMIKKYGGRLPFQDKNGALKTFLIEQISKNKIVIYPVMWRNQGVID